MTNRFIVRYYPIFEKGIFRRHPALFDWFVHHAPPDHLKKEYQKAQETLIKYEGTITWPLIVGPGFCGGTHPGAGNVFPTIMLSSASLIHNGDCLYVNPSHKVFAISDAPERASCSRNLLAKLDHYLQTGSTDEIETIINALNKETRMYDRATLSLICFLKNKSGNRFGKALAFIAGDTYLFHGNIFKRERTHIKGTPEFMGTSYIYLEPKRIDLARGDFFIIVSDGVLSLRFSNKETRLEKILLNFLNHDLESFVSSVIKSCNKSLDEVVFSRVVTRFGDSDNVSVLLVYAEELIETDSKDSFIFGGDAVDWTA